VERCTLCTGGHNRFEQWQVLNICSLVRRETPARKSGKTVSVGPVQDELVLKAKLREIFASASCYFITVLRQMCFVVCTDSNK
jgi:hypothetical protein